MKWISFKDKSPKINEDVLVYKISNHSQHHNCAGIYIGRYYLNLFNRWMIAIKEDNYSKQEKHYPLIDFGEWQFSHWQRLPKKPNFGE